MARYYGVLLPIFVTGMFLIAAVVDLIKEGKHCYHQRPKGTRRAKKRMEALGLLTESFRAWWRSQPDRRRVREEVKRGKKVQRFLIDIRDACSRRVSMFKSRSKEA